jgi:hypothetical protein
MKVFNFTLAFSVMAADELDARVKLKELLKSISKEEILWAMALEEDDNRPLPIANGGTGAQTKEEVKEWKQP